MQNGFRPSTVCLDCKKNAEGKPCVSGRPPTFHSKLPKIHVWSDPYPRSFGNCVVFHRPTISHKRPLRQRFLHGSPLAPCFRRGICLVPFKHLVVSYLVVACSWDPEKEIRRRQLRIQQFAELKEMQLQKLQQQASHFPKTVSCAAAPVFAFVQCKKRSPSFRGVALPSLGNWGTA